MFKICLPGMQGERICVRAVEDMPKGTRFLLQEGTRLMPMIATEAAKAGQRFVAMVTEWPLELIVPVEEPDQPTIVH